MPDSIARNRPIPVRISIDEEDPTGAWKRVTEALDIELEADLSVGNTGRLTKSGDSPCIVVASGSRSIEEACSQAVDSPDEVRGLVLITGLPAASTPPPAVPTLLIRGRQSSRVTHGAGVSAFENLPLGRIVELESCGDEPQADQPEALASTIIWFANSIS